MKPSEYICLAETIAPAQEAQSPAPIAAPLTIVKTDRSHCHILCRRFFICFLLVLVLLLSSVIAIYHKSIFAPNVCQSQECFRSAAAFKQYMDLSVNPCDDFYSYVCGHWAADHPRPIAFKIYNWNRDRHTKIINTIRNQLETNVSRSDPKPVAQAKDMYKACLSSLNATESFEVVQQYLQEFGLPAVPTLLNRTKAFQQDYKFDWVNSVAKIKRKLGLDVLIGFDFDVDHLNRSRFRLTLGYHNKHDLSKSPWYVWQPKSYTSRTSYDEAQNSDIKDDQQNKDPEKLAETLHRLLTLINPTINITNLNSSFSALAEQFLVFDKNLPVLDDEWVDGRLAYYTVAELQNITDSRITPQKPYPFWQHYLDVMFVDLPEIKPPADEKLQIDSRNVEYLSNLTDFLSKQSPELIELYVWKSVTEFLVDHPFNKLQTEENCTQIVQKLMRFAISYTIVDKNFLKETKPRVEQMLDDIRSEFNQMILETDWMDEQTKNASIEKSKATEPLIGFPEWILDVDKLEEHYRGLQVDPSNHFENWVNALQLLTRTELQLWHVNIRNVWNIDPSVVNAFNAKISNVIIVNAAILQYPFYNLGLEALNYGALGEILGHELTHGFDDSGRHFDKFGNYEQTWSDSALEKFNKRASCLIEQYGNYYVPEAKGYISGALTLSENIADNGGIREAFRAYREYVKKSGPEPVLTGFEDFTHDQLFFISFGNKFCETLSPLESGDALKNRHSPKKFRVLGVLSNMEEFSEAFQCPRGSKMNPEKKCRVW